MTGKRFLCIILTVLILLASVLSGVGCTGARTSVSAADTADSETARKPTAAVSLSAEEVDTEEPISSVRYVNEYEVTELGVMYPGFDGYAYSQNNEFTLVYRDIDSGNVALKIFSEDGELLRTVEPPTVSETLQKPEYVYLLPNGTYFMAFPKLFSEPRSSPFYRTLCIVDADGTVLSCVEYQTTALPMMYHVETYEDGTTRILVVNSMFLEYFDTDLNLISGITIEEAEACGFEDWGFGREILSLGNGVFRICTDADSVLRVDMERGTAALSEIRLSKEDFELYFFHVGCDKNDYIITRNGIYRYKDREIPTLLLRWTDAGVSKFTNADTYWIQNQNSIFFVRKAEENGRSVSRLYHIRIRQVPETAREVIKILEYSLLGNSWLENTVAAFNAMQSEYRVELTYLETNMQDDEMSADIRSKLLYDTETDIFFCQRDWLLSPYYDKGAFLDLNESVGDNLLGCVKEAFGYGESLYVLPLQMWMDTFAALTETVDGFLTWETLYEITENLGADELLTSNTDCVADIRENGLMDFVDLETNTAYYDTDGFRRMLLYTASMSDYINAEVGDFDAPYARIGGQTVYLLSNGTLPARVRDGALKLLHVPLESVEVYAMLKLIYGEEDFALCGYPSADGGGASLAGFSKMAIRADTDVPEGCIAFLEYLLSDDVQAAPSLSESYLPVTLSGMSAIIDRNRYWYFSRSTVNSIEKGTNTELELDSDGSTAEYSDSYGMGSVGGTDSYYETVYLTDGDKQKLLDFFDNCHMKANTDTFIRDIVEEELSFWEGGARTLEETTKIIQSRVWIYLNE
ncbi:MAG: extracellular solute-binding protein [Clostridia bacterium]|nr:extracellular solute-binding protein [Clostridia bacterium]